MVRKVRPSTESKYYSLALYCIHLEDYKKALDCLEKVISINSKHEESLVLLDKLRKFLRKKYRNLELFEYRKPKKVKTLSEDKKNYYLEIYNQYLEKGTLEKVGNSLGLTRERVRQILKKGSKHGLYKYPPENKKVIEYQFLVKYFTNKEELLEELSGCNKKIEMLEVLGTDTNYFNQLMNYFGLDVDDIKRYSKRKKYKYEYDDHVKKIGYHPTTTEMRDNPITRNIWNKITRYWGSMANFRKEFDYPIIKRGNPKFRENIREWLQKKSAAAILRKRSYMETILENLSETEVLSKKQLAYKCNISEQNCLIILNRMIKKGHIVRTGGGSQTAYMININQEG